MNDQGVYRSLRRTALALRPPSSGRMISLIRVANEHSIDVNLVLGRDLDRIRDLARCQLGRRPAISLYRRARASAVATLDPSDEGTLTTRERFSVAHELGHCFAYLTYDFKPLTRDDDSARYWRQERAMDEFASALLVPPWLADQWLRESSGIGARRVFRLGRWAKESGVSSEVAARALCGAVPGLGFLKAAEAMRVKDGTRLFVVLHSSQGEGIGLPNQHAHVDDQELLAMVVGKTGTETMQACEIGGHQLGSVQVAWRTGRTSIDSRRKEFRSTIQLSGVVYWICLMDHPECDNARQPDLLSSVS